jgi:hypothetical protein
MKQDIIISINEPPRPEDKRRKGIIRPSLRSKYFARRLQSNDIYLKVFDGGQLVGGSDIAFFGRSTTTTSSFTLNVGGLYGQRFILATFRNPIHLIPISFRLTRIHGSALTKKSRT